MDRITIKDEISLKFNHHVTKKNLKEKTQQMLTISSNGGLFQITPQLLAMLQFFKDQSDIILEDSFGNPILIADLPDFEYKCKIKYNEVMNEWLAEYDRIKKIRKPEQI